MKQFILLSCLIITFTNCQTANNKTLEEFKKVDSSLQKSNAFIIDNEYLSLYQQIQSRKDKNPQLANLVDILFQATENAQEFIDSLNQQLNKLDSSGERLDTGEKLLVNTTVATSLSSKLNLVYTSSFALLDKQKAAQADSLFEIGKEINQNRNWASKYFQHTPTVASITILNKFKNDCLNLAIFTLTQTKAKFY